jgi:hypothetical protein
MTKYYSNTTRYTGISAFYFNRILKTIIAAGKLEQETISILDFGAGFGKLKSMLKNSNNSVINFDKEKQLSEVDDWKTVDFDILVANEVFYSFKSSQLINLLNELKDHNPRLKLIVGISKQSFLHNLGKYILGYDDAHNATILKPKEEIKILKTHMHVIAHKSVWYLCDVYILKFN